MPALVGSVHFCLSCFTSQDEESPPSFSPYRCYHRRPLAPLRLALGYACPSFVADTPVYYTGLIVPHSPTADQFRVYGKPSGHRLGRRAFGLGFHALHPGNREEDVSPFLPATVSNPATSVSPEGSTRLRHHPEGPKPQKGRCRPATPQAKLWDRLCIITPKQPEFSSFTRVFRGFYAHNVWVFLA